MSGPTIADIQHLQQTGKQSSIGQSLKNSGASTPLYTGNPNNFLFGGGAGGSGAQEGTDAMNARYTQAQSDYANRTAPQITGANINATPQGQTRNYQTNLLAQLQQRAMGQGPQSASEQQAIQQGRLGMNQAQALGLSARGAGGASALRQSVGSQGQIGVGAQQQQAQVRIAEQQQAQQSLGALAGQLRGQDIGFAGSQANLMQQAGLSNQQSALQQQAQNDKMVQFYTSMGMSLEQAQLQAQMAQQQMLSDIVRNQYNAEAGINSTDQQTSAANSAAQMGAAGAALSTGVQAYSAYNAANPTPTTTSNGTLNPWGNTY